MLQEHLAGGFLPQLPQPSAATAADGVIVEIVFALLPSAEQYRRESVIPELPVRGRGYDTVDEVVGGRIRIKNYIRSHCVRSLMSSLRIAVRHFVPGVVLRNLDVRLREFQGFRCFFLIQFGARGKGHSRCQQHRGRDRSFSHR